MTAGSRGRPPPLTLVTGQRTDNPKKSNRLERELDWSILMARAQAGDGSAYRRLLEEVTPYLRSLAARRHRSASDVEDAIQDILLTVHAIRASYDPTRPFAPWLVAIANRRLVDRLRRQGRQRSREVALTFDHEDVAEQRDQSDEPIDRFKLQKAIERLPHSQKQAITLLKLRELSLKDASEDSQISIGALKVATHRALQTLRKALFDRNEP